MQAVQFPLPIRAASQADGETNEAECAVMEMLYLLDC